MADPIDVVYDTLSAAGLITSCAVTEQYGPPLELESGHVLDIAEQVVTALEAAGRLLPDNAQGPDPMPVFVIKAQDMLAHPAVKAYRDLCLAYGAVDQAAEVRQALLEIGEWQARNADRLKLPDHPHVPVAAGPGSVPRAPRAADPTAEDRERIAARRRSLFRQGCPDCPDCDAHPPWDTGETPTVDRSSMVDPDPDRAIRAAYLRGLNEGLRWPTRTPADGPPTQTPALDPDRPAAPATAGGTMRACGHHHVAGTTIRPECWEAASRLSAAMTGKPMPGSPAPVAPLLAPVVQLVGVPCPDCGTVTTAARDDTMPIESAQGVVVYVREPCGHQHRAQVTG